MQHLRADHGGDGFRTTATSTDRERPVTVASLGITLAGGSQLEVRNEQGRPWPTTAEAFRRAWAETERADAEARRADAGARRAEGLAALLRDAGLDPHA